MFKVWWMDQLDQDISLMLRARDGDEKAFEALVERHKTRVFHLAYRQSSGRRLSSLKSTRSTLLWQPWLFC